MTDMATPIGIEDLPPEIIIEILRNLSLRKKLRLEAISRTIQAAVQESIAKYVRLKLRIVGDGLLQTLRSRCQHKCEMNKIPLIVFDEHGIEHFSKVCELEIVLAKFHNLIHGVEFIFSPHYCGLEDNHLAILQIMEKFHLSNLRSLKFSKFTSSKNSWRMLNSVFTGTENFEIEIPILQTLDFGEINRDPDECNVWPWKYEESGLKMLDRCPNLKILRMKLLFCPGHYQIMNFQNLPKKLETLVLHDYNFDEDKSEESLIGKIKNIGSSLKRLSFIHCELISIDLSELVQFLPNLTFLDMSFSQFQAVHKLESLRVLSLKTLNLTFFTSDRAPSFEGGVISSWIGWDSNMRKTLEVLSIPLINELPADDIMAIGQFERLNALNLDCTGSNVIAVEKMFKDCKSLEIIKVGWNYEFNQSLELFANSASLIYLDLNNCLVEDLDVKELETFVQRCVETNPQRRPMTLYINKDLFEKVKQFEHPLLTLLGPEQRDHPLFRRDFDVLNFGGSYDR